jgi:hypothetical protein
MMVPDTVAPLVGEVIETVTGAFELFTVIDTPALVALLFEVSMATAVSVWVPLASVVVFSDSEYGEVVANDPKAAPSTSNCTLATATLSVAVAVTVMVPDTVAPLLGEVMETVGAVVSFALFTVIDTPALVALLFELSVATAVSVWVPLASVVVFSDCEYGEVVANDPKAAPSTLNCTLATATLSVAVAVTVMVPDTVAPFAGVMMETVGAVGLESLEALPHPAFNNARPKTAVSKSTSGTRLPTVLIDVWNSLISLLNPCNRDGALERGVRAQSPAWLG